MPIIDLRRLQPLVDRLNELGQRAVTDKGTAEINAADVQSLTAGALKDVPCDGNGKVDATRWSALSADEQLNRYQHLTRVSEAAAALLHVDGPSDRTSIMFREYLSNRWVIALTLLAVFGTIGDLVVIHKNYESATSRLVPSGSTARPGSSTGATGAIGTRATSGAGGASGTSGASGAAGAPATQPAQGPQQVQQTIAMVRPGPLEQDVLLMVILMGALGGFLHLTSSLAKYVGNRQLLRSWVIYYLLMPVEGSALAVAVYLLLRVGVLNPSSTNADSTGNLNWVGIYGFSVLAGIFSKQALEMLGNVFNTIFAKVQGKDSTTGAKVDNSGKA